MTEFRTIASGSSGNASLLSCGSTHILIDMGVSCRRICAALKAEGLTPENLDGILITHEHSDHIQGLATYCKKFSTPIFCTPGTGRQLSYRVPGAGPLLHPVVMGMTFVLGEAEVTPLPTSHDCRESAAFLLTTADGSVGCLTDTGYIPEETGRRMLGAELLLLESNHNVEMLKNGPYSYTLKQRILGNMGHLSNEAAARYAAVSAQNGTGTIILAHLSDENNTPELALEAVGQALEQVGYRGTLEAAPRREPSRIYKVEKRICSV